MAERRQSTASALVWSVVSGVALPLATLITSPLLARALGPEGRGAAAAVGVPLTVLPILLSFGLGDSLLYHVASRRTSTWTAVRLSVMVGGGLGLLATAVLWVSAPVLLRQFPEHVDLMRLIALTVPITSVLACLRGVAQGERYFQLVNVERVVTVVLRVLGVAVAFVLGLLTVASSLWITFLAALAAAFVLVPLALRARPGRTSSESEDRDLAQVGEPFPEATVGTEVAETSLRRAMGPVTRYGFRTWVGGSVGFLLSRVDQPLLALIASPRQLGFYAVAAAVAEVPAVALGAVREVIFSTAAGRGAPEVAAMASRGLLLVSSALALAGILALPVAVPVLFGAEFADAVPIGQILLAGSIPAALSQVLGVGLLGVGRTGPWSIVTVFNLVASVLLLLALTPVFGGIGAATGVAIARTAAFLVLALVFAKITGVPFRRCVVPGREDLDSLRARLVGLLRRRRESDGADVQHSPAAEPRPDHNEREVASPLLTPTASEIGADPGPRRAEVRGRWPGPLRRLRALVGDPVVVISAMSVGATTVLVLALHVVGPRLVLMAGVAFAVSVVTVGTSLGIRLALVTLPFMGLLRRVTAGPDAYVENDPLVILPLLLCLSALLTRLPCALTGARRWIVAYLLWLAVTAVLALPLGLVTVAYGVVFAGLPAVVGLLLASGAYRALPAFAFRSAAVLSIPVALYGITQSIEPASWDLAWLQTVQDQINSIGPAKPGQFRVFGSMEAPLPYALYLGLGAVVVLAALLVGGREETGVRLRSPWLPATVVLPLAMAGILLSSVRSVLFALPVVLLLVAVLRRGAGRWTGLLAAGSTIGLVLLAPQLDALTPQGVSGDRYSLQELEDDQSVTDRLAQLEVVGPALTRPFGDGPASATVATRLSGSNDNAANADNGYVTLLLEGGLVRLVLFVGIAALAVAAAVRQVRREDQPAADRQLALVVLAVLLYTLVLQASYNVVSGATGLFYWIAVGAALRGGVGEWRPSTVRRAIASPRWQSERSRDAQRARSASR